MVIEVQFMLLVPFTSREVRLVLAPTFPPKLVPALEVSFNVFAPSTVEVKLMLPELDSSSVFAPRVTAPV